MTEKKTFEELRLINIAAQGKVQLGGIYRHTTSGGTYSVKIVSLREEDLEPLVTYTPISNEGTHFTRPLTEFLEKFTKLPARW